MDIYVMHTGICFIWLHVDRVGVVKKLLVKAPFDSSIKSQ